MNAREKRSSESSRRCIYCGRFIAYAEFETGKATSEFTPDTDFTSEQIDWLHIACREKSEA